MTSLVTPRSALVLCLSLVGSLAFGCLKKQCDDGSEPGDDCICDDGTMAMNCDLAEPGQSCDQDDGNGHVNSRTPVDADETVRGVICDGADEDFFGITGADGKGSVTVSVVNLAADSGAELSVNVSSLEAFTVLGGSSAELTVGSTVDLAHSIKLSAESGPVRYELELTFNDSRFELEHNGHTNSANPIQSSDVWSGRIQTGSDTDWFGIQGADGKGSVTFELTHLGTEAQDADLAVSINGGEYVESLSQGVSRMLTVGSTFDRTHRVELSAERGPVPYSIQATFADDLYEVEANGHVNSANPILAERTYRGRLQTTADTDWFGIAGIDGHGLLRVAVKPLDGGTISVQVGDISKDVAAGDAAIEVPSTVDQQHRIGLSALDGTPASYELEVSFTD